ncbi:endonuclease/exonuclease/phosphatase family protein [Candidatus Woesearchaeota archaeon]|nr:endonuclease/exonuclease/phosphatase family protein [Candidatus Woesearchaeota archaeon]
MKLVSLNLWAGREFTSLMDYVAVQARSTDVFCFQEVFHTPTLRKTVSEYYRANLYSELQKILPNHTGHFAPAQDGYGFNDPVDYPLQWGLAMFVGKDLKRDAFGEIYLFGSYNRRQYNNSSSPRNLQYLQVNVDGQDYTIAHFHGLWNGQGKTDTADRLEQSRRAKQLLAGAKGKKILCGDFNLLPDTQSLAILKDGLVDLIETWGITTTRSSLYQKPDRYADYTLVSPDVEVEHFAVPTVNVSDHLPMELRFS